MNPDDADPTNETAMVASLHAMVADAERLSSCDICGQDRPADTVRHFYTDHLGDTSICEVCDAEHGAAMARGTRQLVLDARARETYDDHYRDSMRDTGRGHLLP